MKKILWFSRHSLTKEQLNDLNCLFSEELNIRQIDKTINSVVEIKEDLDWCDVAIVVMPIEMQKETLMLLGGKIMMISRNHRILQSDGSYKFVHAGFDRIERIEIVKYKLTDHLEPKGAFRGANDE